VSEGGGKQEDMSIFLRQRVAITVMETSPGDETINDNVKLCLFFNSNIAADLAKLPKDHPNGIIWMPICT
jgi:hypothetical protein